MPTATELFPGDRPDPELIAAAEARAAGMTTAEAHAGERWQAEADAALDRYLRSHPTFFVDDFWSDSGLTPPPNARALGPVVQRARRRGHIERTGSYRPSIRSNLSDKPVWRSLIFEGHEPSPGDDEDGSPAGV